MWKREIRSSPGLYSYDVKHYLFGKLSEINYRMAVHEADANRRLASEGLSLLIIPTSAVPARFQKQFSKLRALIEDAYARVTSRATIQVNSTKSSIEPQASISGC